jgi:hypothetical protein
MPIDTPEKLRAAVNEILEVLPNDLADLVVVLGAARMTRNERRPSKCSAGLCGVR